MTDAGIPTPVVPGQFIPKDDVPADDLIELLVVTSGEALAICAASLALFYVWDHRGGFGLMSPARKMVLLVWGGAQLALSAVMLALGSTAVVVSGAVLGVPAAFSAAFCALRPHRSHANVYLFFSLGHAVSALYIDWIWRRHFDPDPLTILPVVVSGPAVVLALLFRSRLPFQNPAQLHMRWCSVSYVVLCLGYGVVMALGLTALAVGEWIQTDFDDEVNYVIARTYVFFFAVVLVLLATGGFWLLTNPSLMPIDYRLIPASLPSSRELAEQQAPAVPPPAPAPEAMPTLPADSHPVPPSQPPPPLPPPPADFARIEAGELDEWLAGMRVGATSRARIRQNGITAAHLLHLEQAQLSVLFEGDYSRMAPMLEEIKARDYALVTREDVAEWHVHDVLCWMRFRHFGHAAQDIVSEEQITGSRLLRAKPDRLDDVFGPLVGGQIWGFLEELKMQRAPARKSEPAWTAVGP